MTTGTPKQALRTGGMLCMLMASLCAWGASDADDWRSEKNEDGIHVYSRAVEGSAVRAIKAQVDVDVAFDTAVSLLLDVSQRPRWDELCAEASVVRQVSETEDLIYVHNDLPWPVSDRDMVLRRVWAFDADHSRVQIRSNLVDGVLPEVDGRVRMAQADGVWSVERSGESGVRIMTEVHVDPGGPVPDWLLNSLSVQGPYKALGKIRSLLESGDYSPA